MVDKKLVLIFDIDGTLAYNDTDRSIRDFPPIKEVLRIALAAQNSNKTKMAIVTARPESSRKDTEMWLKRQGLEPEILLMRGKDDFRPDYEVRVDQVEKVMKEMGGNAVLYDDKLSNCREVKEKLKISVNRVLS